MPSIYLTLLSATTYRLASHLPASLLDTLLNFPYYLIAVRNALLPAQPFVIPPSDVEELPLPAAPAAGAHKQTTSENDESSGNERSETGSDADVESNNTGDASSVDHSWISLNTSHGDA